MDAKNKYVRVMADWCATPLWRKDGIMMDIDKLPISSQLAYDLGQWAFWHDSRKSDEELKSSERFSAFGLDIANRIKKELPDWTVVYFDVAKHDLTRPRSEYEYEIECKIE